MNASEDLRELFVPMWFSASTRNETHCSCSYSSRLYSTSLNIGSRTDEVWAIWIESTFSKNGDTGFLFYTYEKGRIFYRSCSTFRQQAEWKYRGARHGVRDE